MAAPAQPEEWQKELRMCPFVNVLKPGATLVNVGASVTLSDETLAKLDEFWPARAARRRRPMPVRAQTS